MVWPRLMRPRAGTVPVLVVIGLLALALRVIYVFGWHHPSPIQGDAFYYHYGANLFAAGKGFPDPYIWDSQHVLVPGAQHPPLYIIALAIPSVLHLRSFLDHQLFSCLIGAGSVVMVGLAARRLIGPRAAIFAALVATFYPEFWLNDALVMSETLSIFLSAAVIVAAYRFVDRRSLWRAFVLGALIGLAALTRAELILYAVLIAVPLILLPRAGWRQQWRRRIGTLALAGAGCVVILAPWAAYNLSRFNQPEILSSGLGSTLFVANCPSTWSGSNKGWWDYYCIVNHPRPPGDASDQDVAYRHQALDFIRAHESGLPMEMVARVGRVWGYYHPAQQLHLDVFENRPLAASKVGLGMFYVLAAGAIPGAIILRRRRVPLSPLLAPAVTVTISAAVFYGTTRFRAAAEPSLVLLATVTVAAIGARVVDRFRADRDGKLPAGSGGGVDEPATGPGDELARAPGT